MPLLTVTLHITGQKAIDDLLPGIATSVQSALNNSLNPVLTALSQTAGINAGNADVDPENHVQCQSPLLLPGA
jgi:hypothetical protein